jgi:hypothetical protein
VSLRLKILLPACGLDARASRHSNFTCSKKLLNSTRIVGAKGRRAGVPNCDIFATFERSRKC